MGWLLGFAISTLPYFADRRMRQRAARKRWRKRQRVLERRVKKNEPQYVVVWTLK